MREATIEGECEDQLRSVGLGDCLRQADRAMQVRYLELR